MIELEGAYKAIRPNPLFYVEIQSKVIWQMVVQSLSNAFSIKVLITS